jgi:hypothetical protein
VLIREPHAATVLCNEPSGEAWRIGYAIPEHDDVLSGNDLSAGARTRRDVGSSDALRRRRSDAIVTGGKGDREK